MSYFCRNESLLIMLIKKIIPLFVLIGCLCFPLLTNAQPDPGCNPDDPLCPIDGGLSLLVAAGIGVGARKAYLAKKKNTKTEI
jgi:hypothetical protein